MLEKYEITEKTTYSEEIGNYTAYGIKCENGEYINEISPDKEFVEEIASKLNENGVDPIHFREVVEDCVCL